MRQSSSNLCTWSHWDNNWMLIAWIWIPVGWWQWLRARQWSSTLTSGIAWQIAEAPCWIPVKTIGATVFKSESIFTTSVEASAVSFMWKMDWITSINIAWATSVHSAFTDATTWEIWQLWHLWSIWIGEVNWWSWSNCWGSWERIWNIGWYRNVY